MSGEPFRRLLAESAIEKGNYEIAEKAFVCCHDYQGIQFIKRLKKLDVSTHVPLLVPVSDVLY